jgi:hypothetical protein
MAACPEASVTWTAPEFARQDEPFTGPERPMLEGFLNR